MSDAIFEFCVVPCNDVSQTLVSYELSNSLDEPSFSYKNVFGSEINRVRSNKTFHNFKFSMKAKVEKKNIDNMLNSFFTPAQEQEQLSGNDFIIDHHLYLKQTPYTDPGKENEENLLKLRPDQSVLDFLKLLNTYIYKNFDYRKNSTDVKSTVKDVLKIKAGVCQDFAHLFVSTARFNNIPARYVSGYLNQGRDFIGSSLMHAWVEAFVPAVGWVGFDPTNDLLCDMHYIKVAHGGDYSDCSPIKGVIKTAGENKTTYQVQVVEQQQQ